MQVATRALDPDPRTFLSLIRIRIYFPSESRREKLKEKNEKMKEMVVIGFFIQKFNVNLDQLHGFLLFSRLV